MFSTSAQRPFTDAYLLAYSDEHVFYEFDMFLWLAQVCGKGTKLGASKVADTTRLNNVLIEAFAVHLRNVIDFLYLEKPRKNDVIAADFYVPGGWEVLRPAISTTLESARGRANKEISHLTTGRITGSPPAKAWDFTALAEELRPLMQLMARQAVAGRLSLRVLVPLHVASPIPSIDGQQSNTD